MAWVVFGDGTSGATGATVTGLTNGVKYEFRVAAVNSQGQGPYSNVAGPYTPGAQTWTGHTLSVEASLSSGSFVGGASTWIGHTLSVEVRLFSGAFAGSGTQVWVGHTLTVGVRLNSGSYSGSSQNWTGHTLLVHAAFRRGEFVGEILPDLVSAPNFTERFGPPTDQGPYDALLTRPYRRVDIYNFDGSIFMSDAPIVGGGGGAVSIDYNRDERRVGDLALWNIDHALDIGPNGLWYDKVIKLYRGLTLDSGDTEYWCIGTMMIDRLAQNSTSSVVSISMRDKTKMMIKSKFGRATSFLEDIATDATDNFDRSNSVTQLGTASGGLSWVPLTGVWGISSNQAYVAVGSGHNVAVLDTTYPNVRVEVTIATYQDNMGIVFRAQNATNYLMFIFLDDRWEFFEVINNSFATAKAVGPGTFTHGDVMKVEAIGSSVKLYRNGVLIGSAFSNQFLNETKCGLRHYVASGAGTGRFDNFIATTTTQSIDIATIIKALAINSGITDHEIPLTGRTLTKTYTFDRNTTRWAAAKEIANAYGYELYVTPHGALAMREFVDPLTAQVAMSFYAMEEEQVVEHIAHGHVPNVATYDRSAHDDRLYNHVIVEGVDQDGNVLFSAEAVNDDPSSPTSRPRIGPREYPFTSRFIESEQQAQDTADAFLRIHAQEQYEFNLGSGVYPWIEGGNAVLIEADHGDDDALGPIRFLALTATIPMDLGNMSLGASRVSLVGSLV